MNENGDVKASMEKFMDTISPMDIPRIRRKQTPTVPQMKKLLASFQLLES